MARYEVRIWDIGDFEQGHGNDLNGKLRVVLDEFMKLTQPFSKSFSFLIDV